MSNDNIESLRPGADIEALKKKHGQIYELGFEQDDQEYCLICRMPKTADLSRFAKSSRKDDVAAARNMLIHCMIKPAFADLKSLFDLQPALILVVAGKLFDLIGADVEVSAKKL